MAEPLLEIRNLSKRFGGFTALDGVSLELGERERLALIGPNGSGKTTLINCMSGVLRADGGRVVFKGQDVNRLPAHRRVRLGMMRSFQIPRPFRSLSVIENLYVPLEFAHGAGGAHGRDLRAEAMAILDGVGFADRADARPVDLTQVDLRKLELARALAARPALLVVDEAMAGLSSAEVDDILGVLFKLNEQGVAVIMIEHIMRAVMRFAERVVVLDAGQKIADGTPDQVINDPAVERAYLGA
jgi:branched-chain amino acid transport system ATP-binding protein